MSRPKVSQSVPAPLYAQRGRAVPRDRRSPWRRACATTRCICEDVSCLNNSNLSSSSWLICKLMAKESAFTVGGQSITQQHSYVTSPILKIFAGTRNLASTGTPRNFSLGTVLKLPDALSGCQFQLLTSACNSDYNLTLQVDHRPQIDINTFEFQITTHAADSIRAVYR
jgi:hypothetical protein